MRAKVVELRIQLFPRFAPSPWAIVIIDQRANYPGDAPGFIAEGSLPSLKPGRLFLARRSSEDRLGGLRKMLRRVPEIENPDGLRVMLFDQLPVPKRAVAQDDVKRFRVARQNSGDSRSETVGEIGFPGLWHRAYILGREPFPTPVVKGDRAAHRFFVVFTADWRGCPVKASRHNLNRSFRRGSLQLPSRGFLNGQAPDLLREITNETGREL